jgi:hypothetical protein
MVKVRAEIDWLVFLRKDIVPLPTYVKMDPTISLKFY